MSGVLVRPFVATLVALAFTGTAVAHSPEYSHVKAAADALYVKFNRGVSPHRTQFHGCRLKPRTKHYWRCRFTDYGKWFVGAGETERSSTYVVRYRDGRWHRWLDLIEF